MSVDVLPRVTPDQLERRMFRAATTVSAQARILMAALGVQRRGASVEVFPLQDAIEEMARCLDAEDESRAAFLLGPL
jgi:hypothetical protein